MEQQLKSRLVGKPERRNLPPLAHSSSAVRNPRDIAAMLAEEPLQLPDRVNLSRRDPMMPQKSNSVISLAPTSTQRPRSLSMTPRPRAMSVARVLGPEDETLKNFLQHYSKEDLRRPELFLEYAQKRGDGEYEFVYMRRIKTTKRTPPKDAKGKTALPSITRPATRNRPERVWEEEGIIGGSNPYALEIVPFSRVDQSNYYTLSVKGLTHYCGGECTFISVEDWLTERRLFRRLQTLPVFRDFLTRKYFRLWHQFCRNTTLRMGLATLTRNSYAIMPDFYRLVLQTQEWCLDMQSSAAPLKFEIKPTHLKSFVQLCAEVFTGLSEDITNFVKQLTMLTAVLCQNVFGEFDQRKIEHGDSDVAWRRRRAKTLISLVDIMIFETMFKIAMTANSRFIGDLTSGEALFFVKIDIRRDGIIMAPSPADFSAWIQRVLADVITLCDSYSKVAENRAIVPYLFSSNNSGDKLALKAALLADEKYAADIEQIKGLIDSSCIAVRRRADTFSPMVRLISEDSDLDVSETVDKTRTPTAEELGGKIACLEGHMADIKAVCGQEHVGPFLVDSHPVADALVPICTSGINQLMDRVPEVATAQAERFTRRVTGITEKLAEEPASLATVAALLAYHNEVSETTIEEVEVDLKEVDAMFQLLLSIGREGDLDVAAHSSATASMENLMETLAQFPGRRLDLVSTFTPELNDAVKGVHEALDTVWELIVADDLSNPETPWDEAVSRLTRARVRSLEILDEAETLVGYGTLLGVKVEKPPRLGVVEQEARLRRLMWECLHELRSLTTRIMPKAVTDLDMTDFNTVIGKIFDSSPALADLYENGKNAAYNELTSRLDQLRRGQPLLDALSSVILTDEDWAVIRQYIPANPPVPTEDVLDPLAMAFKDEILAVTAQAELRWHISKQLQNTIEVWETKQVNIIRVPGTRDAFLLKGVEALRDELDDSEASLTTLSCGTSDEEVQEIIATWLALIGQVRETLDVWVRTQTLWYYLYDIFTAPDVQRQLVSEAKIFRTTDAEFRGFMRAVYYSPSLLAGRRDEPRTEEATAALLTGWLAELETVRRGLGAYLDSKRRALPRFYFLSDDSLLRLINDSRQPLDVLPHLPSLFSAVSTLTVEDREGLVITGFGDSTETVSLLTPLRPRGAVEYWLDHLDTSIANTLKEHVGILVKQPTGRSAANLLDGFPAQVALTAIKFYFTRDVNRAIHSKPALGSIKSSINGQIQVIATMLQQDIAPVRRSLLSATVVLLVHHRDIMSALIASDSPENVWNNELRLNLHGDDLDFSIASSRTPLSFEYVGNTTRLVVTPLTTRCWRTIFTALKLGCGTAPRGPAGTGKTETVKDLSRYLGRHLVVFNCGPDVQAQTMTSFFSGVIQTGAWAIFDEFNRLSVEVLSVVAETLHTILTALRSHAIDLDLHGQHHRVDARAAIFITMNPGYAGRQELPENLKALFRPVSMILPNAKFIGEVLLHCAGFVASEQLAVQLTRFLDSTKARLSHAPQYDYSLRTLKATVAEASLHRWKAQGTIREAELLAAAVKKVITPRLEDIDRSVFHLTLHDVFGDVHYTDESDITEGLCDAASSLGLSAPKPFVDKAAQILSSVKARTGTILIGPPASGKSAAIAVLQEYCKTTGPEESPLTSTTVFPRAMLPHQLFGKLDTAGEWQDGIVPRIARSRMGRQGEHWIVMDGPLDSDWVENLNSVLDDTHVLTLASGESIVIPRQMKFIFETISLASTSPATVSRCAIVTFDAATLNFEDVASAKVQDLFKPIDGKQINLGDEAITSLRTDVLAMINHYMPLARELAGTDWDAPPIADPVSPTIRLLQAMLERDSGFMALYGDGHIPIDRLTLRVLHHLVIALIWSLGGWIYETTRREAFAERIHMYNGTFALPLDIPGHSDLFQLAVDFTPTVVHRQAALEGALVIFDVDTPVSRPPGIIPVPEQEAFLRVGSLAVDARLHTLIAGPVGSGRRTLARAMTAPRTHEVAFLDWRQDFETTLDLLTGPTALVRLSGLDVPRYIDQLGNRPVLELLRQVVDRGCVCTGPGTATPCSPDLTIVAETRTTSRPVPEGLARHFLQLSAPELTEESLQSIFTTRTNTAYEALDGQRAFPSDDCLDAVPSIVRATVRLFMALGRQLMPSRMATHLSVPALGTLAVFFDRFLAIRPSSIESITMFKRVWASEVLSLIGGRMTVDEHKTILSDAMRANCPPPMDDDDFKPLHITDIARCNIIPTAVDRPLVVAEDSMFVQLQRLAPDAVTLFASASESINSAIRVLRQTAHHLMLLGTPGTGRRTTARVAARASGFELIMTSTEEEAVDNAVVRALSRSSHVLLVADVSAVSETVLDRLMMIASSADTGAVAASETAAMEGVAESNIDRVRELVRVCIIAEPGSEVFNDLTAAEPFFASQFVPVATHSWTEADLIDVGKPLLQRVATRTLGDGTASLAVSMFMATRETAASLPPLHPAVVVPPALFIQFLHLFDRYLTKLRTALAEEKQLVSDGSSKLAQASDTVASMETDLLELRPELDRARQRSHELTIRLSQDREKTEESRKVVAAEEAVLKEKRLVIEKEYAEAEADLAVVLPALQEAEQALKALNKNDIVEIRSFVNPPPQVALVVHAVCVARGVPPSWAAGRQLLGEYNFIETLVKLDKTNIPAPVLTRLRKFVEDPDFNVSKMRSVSVAATSICQWVHATVKYAEHYVIVAPRKARLDDAASKLNEAERSLDAKRRLTAELEARMQSLTEEYAETTAQTQKLGARINDTNERLQRAKDLTAGLEDEKARWSKEAADINAKLAVVEATCLLRAAIATFTPPFELTVTHELVGKFNRLMESAGHPTIDGIHWADAMTIQGWNAAGLPPDEGSVLAACICQDMAGIAAFPTIMDPQRQYRSFLEALGTITPGEARELPMIMASAARRGGLVIVEDCSPRPPALEAVIQYGLARSLQADPPLTVTIAGDVVRPLQGFHVILVSHVVSPKLPTEAFIQSPPINCDAVHVAVVSSMRVLAINSLEPALEAELSRIIQGLADDQKAIRMREREMLSLLREQGADLLADTAVVAALQKLKSVATTLADRIEQSRLSHARVTEARERYTPLARRGAALYAAASSLAGLDQLYHTSLQNITRVFSSAVITAPVSATLDSIISLVTESIIAHLLTAVHPNHRPTVVMLCLMEVAMEQGVPADIARLCYTNPTRVVRKCPAAGIKLPSEHPDSDPIPDGLSADAWEVAVKLDRTVAEFDGLAVLAQEGTLSLFASGSGPFPAKLRQRLPVDPLTRACLVLGVTRLLRPDMLQSTAVSVCPEALGCHVGPTVDFNTVLVESVEAPMLTISAPDLDPVVALDAAVAACRLPEVVSVIVGTPIKQLSTLTTEKPHGVTVLVQNIQLNGPWALELALHAASWPNVRLVFTTDPSAELPPTLVAISNTFHSSQSPCIRDVSLRLIRGPLAGPMRTGDSVAVANAVLAHALLVSRGKFGSFAWETACEFSDADAVAAVSLLTSSSDPAPLIAETIYGGRVTGDTDMAVIREVLSGALAGKSIADAAYHVPHGVTVSSFEAFLTGLPGVDAPELFGLHRSTAKLVYGIEATAITHKLTSIFMRSQAVSESNEWLDDLISSIPSPPTISRVPQTAVDRSMWYEAHYFSKQLSDIASSLVRYKQAISGERLLTPDIIKFGMTLRRGEVPAAWLTTPTKLRLGKWVANLRRRVSQINAWNEKTLKSVWLGGLTKPQDILTATLQDFSRATGHPLTELSYVAQPVTTRPESGIVLSGLTLVGGIWVSVKATLVESEDTAIQPLPHVWLVPVHSYTPPAGLYHCPIYRTSDRGASGLVMTVPVGCSGQPGDWVLRGAAMILEEVQ
ncbi:Dynein heavy chain N-terminal region 2 [Carpediemonas membranifera]|uniref:Dynein heavy chain N-terminal region 2 n=1 Tax=Carpediemonas membranifera TaxID=201153 RepID=A0A8J6BTU7_9EUKA|nr:Dynein heavy chain N-terminal region 2 [Carpediemonas membranifera]|eukprot:KAG9389706.1 Dynein heavy chain N-terminal region 2 [Carpediemonas membranifera]